MPVLDAPPRIVSLSQRLTNLQDLFSRIQPVPYEWLMSKPNGNGNGKSHDKGEPAGMELLDCSDWKTLVVSWRKALKWTEGLDQALSVMLAAVASTGAIGDQLWIKVMAPPSTAKSTLCEAISANPEYAYALSTLTGFHSGFRADGETSQSDNSLIPKIRGKTLLVKDGDTLLQAPNLPQILSEARDLYDSTCRTYYRNKMGKTYEGVRMTWILCGTHSLRVLDSSELGARFLDCVIMQDIDEELEDEILWRVVNRTERNLSIESNGKVEGQNDPELVEAMKLTGGYVGWLRRNAAETLATITMPDQAKRFCTRLGKFVAFMRARPSKRQDEVAEREFATRLVSQLARLAKCLAYVLNRPTVDEEVMARARKVALDTSRGKTLALVSHLWSAPEGLEPRTLALYTSNTETKVRELLRFLSAIHVTETFVPTLSTGGKGRQRWKLTVRMRRLYDEVFNA